MDVLVAFATGLAATTLLFASTGAADRLLTGADGLAVSAFTERLETERAAVTEVFFSPDFADTARAELLGEPDETAGLVAFALAVDCFTAACFEPAAGFDAPACFDPPAPFVAVGFKAAAFAAGCFAAGCFAEKLDLAAEDDLAVDLLVPTLEDTLEDTLESAVDLDLAVAD